MEELKWDRMTAQINKDMADKTDRIFRLVFQDGVKKYAFVLDLSDARHLGKISRLMLWEYFKLWCQHPIKMYRGFFSAKE